MTCLVVRGILQIFLLGSFEIIDNVCPFADFVHDLHSNCYQDQMFLWATSVDGFGIIVLL